MFILGEKEKHRLQSYAATILRNRFKSSFVSRVSQSLESAFLVFHGFLLRKKFPLIWSGDKLETLTPNVNNNARENLLVLYLICFRHLGLSVWGLLELKRFQIR